MYLNVRVCHEPMKVRSWEVRVLGHGTKTQRSQTHILALYFIRTQKGNEGT